MSDEAARTEDLPDDEHLRNDVAGASGDEPGPAEDTHYTPGLTNAGQQVAGLASATDYGEEDDPEANNPV
ncbi:hypothetical protein AB0P28_04055 [Pseudarthrobacter sp. NPDC089323]